MLRRARADQGHGRRRGARVDERPVGPRVQRPPVRRLPGQGPRPRRGPRLQRLAHRVVVRLVPGTLHPDGAPGPVGPRARRLRGPPRRRHGLPLDHLHREPARPRLPELPRCGVGSPVARPVRRGGRAVRAPRLVGSAGGHEPRRAGGRHDHPAADEHLRRRSRPALVARGQGVPFPAHRAVGRRDRLDPLLPRAPRPHLRHAPPLDRAGLRAAPSQRGVPRALPDLLHRRSRRHPAAPHHRHGQHRLGVRLPPLRFDLADVARAAGGGHGRSSRRRDRQDDLGERGPLVLVRPVRPPGPGAVHGGGAARRSGRSRRQRAHDGPGPVRAPGRHRHGVARRPGHGLSGGIARPTA